MIGTAWIRWTQVVVVGLFLAFQPDVARAGAPMALQGKEVYVSFPQSGAAGTLWIQGTVTEVTEDGMWLQTTRARELPNTTGGEFVRTVYIPWTNVTYVELAK